MTKLTKQEAEGWLTRMIENSTGDCYALDMTKYTLSLLKAIPEPEPEWGPWTGWNGGGLPETGMIEAAFNDGKIGVYAAEDLRDFTVNLIAYRIKQIPQEPEIWWRQKGYEGVLYHDKEDAMADAMADANELEKIAFEKVSVQVIK